jgi:uncharacterized protein YegJ (DUF2314 family)
MEATSRSLLIGFAISLCVTGFAFSQSGSVKMIHKTDAEMNSAMATGKRTLDEFLKLRSSPPPGAEKFELKVRFSEGDDVEYMWVSPFRNIGNRFEGVLNNQPRALNSVRYGEQVKFDRDQIVDWGYFHNNKTYGHFSTCLLFDRFNDERYRQLRAERGFVCDRTGKELSPKVK